jgi:hypothetical protein
MRRGWRMSMQSGRVVLESVVEVILDNIAQDREI